MVVGGGYAGASAALLLPILSASALRLLRPPPDVGHRRAHAARELISRRPGSRSTELGDSSTTRLTTATADDDTAEDTAYTQDDVI